MRFEFLMAAGFAIFAPNAVTATEPISIAHPQGQLADSEPKPWKAGVARVTITPEHLMWMSGYANRKKPAEGKLHDLWAKALVLEEPNGRRAVLVTMDLVGIPRDLSRSVCEELKRRYGLGRTEIVLNVSHTHTGPVVGNNLLSMYDLDEHQARLVEVYALSLQKKLIAVVGDALENVAPAQITWGKGKATFAVNRRNNKEADVRQLRTAGQLKGPVDHDVPVLAIRDSANQLRAVVCGYACHATVLDFQLWSGDYPGFAQLDLEKAHPEAVALFWAGCGADQNPLPRREVSLAEEYGRQLAESVEEALRKPMTPLHGSLETSYREIDLPFGDLPTREQIVKDTKSENRYIAARAKQLLKQMERDGSLKGTYAYPVQVWQLGRDLTFIMLGGEVVVDYSLRLKKEIGPTTTWVAGYSNDVMAYIPSLRVLKEGGYEGGGAMVYYGLPAAWGAKVEELIVAAVHEEVEKVGGGAAADTLSSRSIPGLAAAGTSGGEGWVSPFNGRDLTGWVNVNCAPGTFFVKEGEIITTGKPTGFLRTERQYENFTAEFDWMHIPPKPGAVGNSGFFVWCDPIPAVGTGYTRGIEVQVLVNLTYKNKKGKITATSQGDLFSIHGATCVPDRPHPDGWARCLPSENHCKGEGEWNHYRVEANDGVIKLAVNGHVVSGLSQCKPRKGYLALESEGSECHFKNLKIKELPSTNQEPDEVAKVAEGHRSMLNGQDLTGWKGDKDDWKVNDGVIHAAGKSPIVSESDKVTNCELIFDWKLPAKSMNHCRVEVGTPDRTVGAIFAQVKEGEVFIGKYYQARAIGTDSLSRYPADNVKPGEWNRAVLRIGDGRNTLSLNGKKVVSQKETPPPAGPVTFRSAEGLELRNIFIREIKP